MRSLDSFSNSASSARNDGWELIRPICPDDEERMVRFHKGLSERSVYMRYFASLSLATRTLHSRLARICLTDPECQTVLAAIGRNPQSGEQDIIGVGRLNKLADPSQAEVAVLVRDEFHGRGLGAALLRLLVQEARKQKIARIEAVLLSDNFAMRRVLKRLGFHLRLVDPRIVRATLSL